MDERFVLTNQSPLLGNNVKLLVLAENLKTYSRKRGQTRQDDADESDDVYFLNYNSNSLRTSPKKTSSGTSNNNQLPNSVTDLCELSTPSSTKSHVKKRLFNLNLKLDICKKRLRAKKMQNFRLKKKATNNNLLASLFKNKSRSVQTFINMQLPTRKKNCWKMDEKHFALSVYYKSPSCYKFLRNNLLFSLPSVRTIQSWLKVINLKTGLDNTLTKKLSIKVKTMDEKERVCALLFDEIVLKPKLDYNRAHDFIEGYEDMGFLGRNNSVANTALVFYIRGIFANWKIPLCYFTSKGPVKGDKLSVIVKYVIQTLHKLALMPLALVCDQGTNNRNAFKILGASKTNPQIVIDKLKIFTIFDAPHLLKSLRNNFINTKLKFKVNGHFVSWFDVIKTYEIDRKSTTTRTLTKLTDIHLYPNNFQKMKVKYAAQIFSNSVAAAVKSAAQIYAFESTTAHYTSDFLKNINNIFDSLNSNLLTDANPNRKPLSIDKPTSLNNLQFGLDYFKTIEIFENGNKRNNIYCIDGFIWTLTSILELWKYLLNSFKCKFLFTSHLNQDPLENLFSVCRNRCGYNPTPSVQQFRVSLQYNINIRLQNALQTGNCEEDTQEFLNLDELNEFEESSQMEETIPSSSNSTNTTNIILENDSAISTNITSGNETSLEICSNVYVAGYFAHIILQKVQCENNCEDFLLKNESEIAEEKELFLLNKDFASTNYISSLKTPSNEFLALSQSLMSKFNMIFEKLKLSNKIFKSIFTILLNEININKINLCPQHIEKFIKLFIKTMIYKQLKWETEKYSKNSKNKNCGKLHRKIRVLSNK